MGGSYQRRSSVAVSL